MDPPSIGDLSLPLQQLTGLVQERALSALNSALVLLPHQEKEAYLEAILRVPHLVQSESDPMSFLRREDYDPYAAALRLVRWWAYRKTIFGQKAFLPLDLSPTGALEQDDIEVISSGAFAVLPEATSGHLVLHLDRRRFPQFMEWHPRRVFFMLAVMSRHEKSQSEGFLATYSFAPQKFLHLANKDLYVEIEHQISNIQPIRLLATHLVSIGQRSENTLVPLLVQKWGPLIAPKVVTHFVDSKQEALQELVSVGFRAESLPSCFGGTWSYQNFQLWILHHRVSPAVADRFDCKELPDDELLPVRNARSEIAESPQMIEHGLAALAEAMQMLPAADSADYFKAMQRVPELVKRESDPLSYLRYDQYNSWEAARRLASYWKYRVIAFGDERAFLPLDQTGRGALDDDMMALLRSGYLCVLPDDKRGRPVLLIDIAKRPSHTPHKRLGVVFYILSVICSHPRASTEGYAVIGIIGNFFKLLLDGPMQRNSLAALAVMAAKPFQHHAVHTEHGPFARLTLYLMLLPTFFRFFQRKTERVTTIHVGDSPAELSQKLEKSGFLRQGIPKAAGGEWDEELDFQTWMRGRRQLESRRSNPTSAAIVKPPERALEQIPTDLMEAMQLVSPSDKAAYLLAMEKSPNLVKSESDPERFQRVTQDPLAAAQRLATYWRTRREIFGETAYLLPLDQTGEGALSRKDIGLLSSGVLRQLPNNSDGLAVVFFDTGAASSTSKVTHESFLRCAFYMFSVACENQKSQDRDKGFAILCRYSDSSIDRLISREWIEMGTSVFTGHLHTFHLLCCRGPQSDRSISDIEGRATKSVSAWGTSIKSKTIVHVVDNIGEYPSRLGAYGFLKTGLPKTVGGSLGVLSLVEWQELRVRYEWSLPIAGSSRAYAESLGIATTKPLPELNDDEKAERRRRMNVVHSRRKREKERLDFEMMQEESVELSEMKSKLQEEGKFLERSLKEASELIAGLPQQ